MPPFRGRDAGLRTPWRRFDSFRWYQAVSGCSSGVRARGRGPRGRWCDSSHSDQCQSGCSSAAEHVADYHGVVGAIPATRTAATVAAHMPSIRGSEHDAAKVVSCTRLLPVVLGYTSPSGTTLDSKSEEQRSNRWRRASSGPVSGSIWAAVWCDSRWVIPGHLTRHCFLGVAQLRRARGSGPRGHRCNSDHPDS